MTAATTPNSRLIGQANSRWKLLTPALILGDKVESLVPHCDPNVNLFDYYHVVREDTLVDIWPVAARGNS